MDLLLKDKNKIVDVVDNIKKNKPDGGANFFDRMDEFVRDPKNVDMVYNLIDKIRKDFNNKFNLIITGKFGDWVYNLIKTGKIKINGIVIHVSGSLRSSIKNKSFQIIQGDENRVYNQNFVLLDDSYYSGSTKKEIDKHLQKYKAKIVKTYVFYDGSFQKRSDVYSIYRYYDYHMDDVLPVKRLLSVLNGIDEQNIPYDSLENQIMKGQIRSVKELLREIQIMKQKFNNSSDKVNIKSYGYKREYEKKKNKHKNKLNETNNFEQSFLVTQFWHKYLREGRNNIRLMLRGREVEFHATSKVDVYRGTIRGLLPALSKKESRIKILIDTHEYGVLEVDNDYPIIVRDIDLDESIKETRETPKEILDIFGDRIKSIKLENNMELKVERTKGSYKIIIVDDNKTVARLYIQSIKNKGGKFYAEVRRVHVNDDYRNKGLGSKLMDYVVKVFGDFNLYLYPSPNRIKDLNDVNREIYRSKLRKFYGKYGFKDIEGKNRMERYVEGIRWYNKGKLGPEEEIIEKGNIFKVGDYIVKSEGDIYKWSSDEINLNSAKLGGWETTVAFDKLETVRVALVDYVNDLKGYTGQVIKINGKWPWYRSANFKLASKLEEVRWYSKGKLGPEEERDVVETNFKIGDRLFMPGGAKGAYWNDGTDSAVRTSLKNPGKWVPYKADSAWTVDRMDFVKDLDGYTGTMVHFDSVCPWFQETGFVISERL